MLLTLRQRCVYVYYMLTCTLLFILIVVVKLTAMAVIGLPHSGDTDRGVRYRYGSFNGRFKRQVVADLRHTHIWLSA